MIEVMAAGYRMTPYVRRPICLAAARKALAADIAGSSV